MGSRTARKSLWSALALAASAALVGGVLVAGGDAAWSAPVQHEQTFGYMATTQSWIVPDGVHRIEVVLRGGQGGNGGADATAAPDPSSYRGLVTGTIQVTPGQILTIAPGQGGATGRSAANGAQAGPLGGLNPLNGYDGGAGGKVGTVGSSGQGGAGGAASVLRIDGQDIVAGGGGGNGGSGQYAPTRGRPADGNFLARTDAITTDGQVGIQPVGSNNDGGGSGGGGGGAQGGAQGTVEFGAGTSTEWFGYGGSVGQNSTASFAGLSASYEHSAQNNANGSIVLRWVTGAAAAPAAPQGTAGIGAVDLFWSAPSEIGEGPIEDYEVQYSSDGGLTWSASQLVGSDATELPIAGLTNGTPYVFRVAAVTPAGTGSFSPASAPLTPYAPPSAPAITHIDPRDGALAVTFDAPVSGAPVTGYQYRVGNGAWLPVSGAAQPIVIPGLVNGQEVDVQIRATSAVGNGAASDPASGTPRAVPGAPTVTGVTTGAGTASIAFAPGFDGGSPITGYEYRVDGGSWVQIEASATSVELSHLASATGYDIEIRAVNAAGEGPASAPARAVTPGVPGALVGTSATGLDGALSVGFAPGANGGSPITRVEYSLDGGTNWESVGTSGPITIGGLVNGTEQSVQLRAVNAIGAGPVTTVAATPATVPSSPIIGSVSDSGAGTLDVQFTPPTSDGGSPITGYEFSTDGGRTWASADATGSEISIAEASDGAALDQDTVYSVVLRAVNAVGAGPASAAVNRLGPVPPVLASAPVITSVDSQPGALAVSFAPGDNGGATVTEYQYSIDGGANWQTTGSLSERFVIGGLADGANYEVRVRAVTGAGDGASSAPASGTPASRPEPPSLDAVQRADGALILALTPGDDGGSAVVDYEYTLDGGSTWASTGQAAGPVTISGLNNGQSYTVQMRAVNAVGASGGSNQLTSAPAAAPPAPSLSLAPGDTTISASASFANDGGAPLTKIEYSTDGGVTWTDTHSLSGGFVLTGLPNGTPVNVRVRGANAIGTGPAAAETATPRTVPGPPTDVATVGNSGSIEVSWTAPGADGGAPITGSTAYAYTSATSTTPVASCVSTGSERCTISGLANGTAYFVAVAATNAAGTGPESLRRSSATPLQRPSAPNLTAATAGDRRLTLAFTAGAAGDRPIQGYEYTLDGGATWHALGSGSPATVSDLTNGTLYDVQIRAVSEAGPGPASVVRSGTPYGYPFVPTGIAVTAGTGNATVVWSPADLNGNTLKQYTVTAFSAQSGGTAVSTCQTTSTSCALPSLTNGTTYWVSIQTEATNAATGTTVYYSERSEPRLPVTPRAAGAAPAFGQPARTADGYTVKISNYQAASVYTLDTSSLPGGASASLSGDTITVVGLAPGSSGSVGVTVSRTGYLDASGSVMGTALDAGVAPAFGAPTRTADGYTVEISNYDASATYALDPSSLPEGATATLAGSTITVTGVDPGVSGTVSVTVSKAGATDASAPVTGTALDAGVAPAFDTPTRTADGFTVELSNYDADSDYVLDLSSLPSGATATRSGGTITVRGVDPGVSATVGVTVSKAGATDASAPVSGTALDAGVAPAFGIPTRTADGFTVEIENYDGDATYTLDLSSLPSGAAATLSGGTVTVTGVNPGETATVGAAVSKNGATDASASVTGKSLESGIVPVFSTPVRTADGYTVEIANFDADSAYALDLSSLPSGASATRSGDTITVTGVAPGISVTVGVTVSKDGATDVSASVTGEALESGITPEFGAPARTADGYTVRITNYDADSSYALDLSSLPSGASATRSGDTITVTGVAPGISATVGVTVSKDGATDASAAVTGAALDAGVAPTFGTPTRTPDGFTVDIANFDTDSIYDLDVSSLPSGASATRSGSTITVTGVEPGETATVEVTVSKAGATDASAPVTGTALDAGMAPVFSTPTRTADGFTAEIANYDGDATYTLDLSSLPSGATAMRSGGTITVTGVEPGETATVGVAVSKAGATDASAPVSGTALDAGVAPTFGIPTRTADGFTVKIANFDTGSTYALDLSSLPSGATATLSGDTITVTGVSPGQETTVGVNVSKAGATDASAAATGAALDAGAPPRLSEPRRTADGFEIVILDYRSDLEYTATVDHGQVRIDGDRIIVSGLQPEERATVTVTASNSDTAAQSAEASGSALPAPEPADNGGGTSADPLMSTGSPGTVPLVALAVMLVVLAGAALLLGRRRGA